MVKVGRVSYLSAHVVVPEGFELSRVDELDEIRRHIAAGIQEIHPSWTVDTIFVADESLVGAPTPEFADQEATGIRNNRSGKGDNRRL
jgi:hypothetical protein